jgi:hypothetical protein
MDAADVAAYRARHTRARRAVWWLLVIAALGVGYGIGLLVTLPVGAIATIVSIAAVQPMFLRWDRAAWLKRFPKLADSHT